MISPRLSKVVGGTRLTTDLINSMIKRTEYAADLLQQYKLIAGNQMYIEPHYDGTRVSYLQPVGGGATPTPIVTTDEYGFDFIKPNVQYTFPSFTAPPGELLGPGINISKATSGRLVISGGAWEHGVFAPDNGFVRGYGSGTTLTLPIPFGQFFVGWISCGYGPTFPFTGGTIQWVTD
jgi:hypothetical protein